MPIIPKDQESELRQQRETLELIKEAHRHPQPVSDPGSYLIPPSERTSRQPWGSPEWYAVEYHRWKDRAESLQSDRDHFLHENVKLLRLIHALMDSAGAIAVGMKVKKWLLSNDEGVCPLCEANAQQGWIAIDLPYASGALAPLDHAGCRCDAVYRRAVP